MAAGQHPRPSEGFEFEWWRRVMVPTRPPIGYRTRDAHFVDKPRRRLDGLTAR